MRKEQDRPLLAAMAAEIKARRADLQISQDELALRSEVHRTSVARLELAKVMPSVVVLWQLAEALEVDVADFVGGIEQRRRKEMRRAARS